MIPFSVELHHIPGVFAILRRMNDFARNIECIHKKLKRRGVAHADCVVRAQNSIRRMRFTSPCNDRIKALIVVRRPIDLPVVDCFFFFVRAHVIRDKLLDDL